MSDGDSLRSRIVALLDSGNIDGALELIDAAVAQAEPFERTGLRLMQGRLLLAVGDASAALAAFAEALDSAIDPDQQGEALLARAEAAESLGDIDAARADLEQARAAFENVHRRAGAEHLLGRIERDHGDLPAAIDLLGDAY
ncbi:MAG: tetratricopeptide repeat protein, partial [Thermomicrobiales bacterium]